MEDPTHSGGTSPPPGMDDLTAQFRRRLQEHIGMIEAARASLSTDLEARARVRGVAHALKGSGGTYGFPGITAAAADVERAPDEALDARLQALLDVLRSEAVPEAVAAASPGPAASGAGETNAQSPRASVLVVDDDPDITRLLSHCLAAPDREIQTAATAAAADRVLARRTFDLIILDLVLPDADGRTLLAELREAPRTAAVPIVMLSGLRTGRAQTECFALGADAYIEKPFDPMVVVAAVTSKLERVRHVAPRAGVDGLTLLSDRAAFRHAFERATARPGPSLSIALLELDQHGAILQAQGWGSADRAIALGGQALSRALSSADTLAHWSGAAFAALLVDADEPHATAAVEQALETLHRTAPSATTTLPALTFSAGVAAWGGAQALDDLVAEAERYLLLARAGGGGAVRSQSRPGAASSHTILFAEDDDLIAAVVKHRLEREGMTVEHFADGTSAFEAARRLAPALAILDVKMPGMDGFELLGRLRAEAALSRTPILMLTSMGSEHDIVRGLQLGADEYMVKPFSPVELVARVRRLLERR